MEQFDTLLALFTVEEMLMVRGVRKTTAAHCRFPSRPRWPLAASPLSSPAASPPRPYRFGTGVPCPVPVAPRRLLPGASSQPSPPPELHPAPATDLSRY